MKKHSDIPMRNNDAKAIRSIRKLLRANNPIEVQDELEEDEAIIHSALWVIGCILMAGLMLIGSCSLAHSYTVDELATAIGRAENSKTHPYGIMTHYKHTTPRQACINTIRHVYRNLVNIGHPGAFLPYLANVYAPLNASNDPKRLNRYWLTNVSYFLKEVK